MSSDLLPSEIDSLEKVLGYSFKEKEILRAGICHSSFHNAPTEEKKITNERLEFLGASVLGLIIADRAFEKLVNLKEGALRRLRSKLNRESVCAQYFAHLRLSQFAQMGKSERTHLEEIGNDRIASEIIKSIIGAIFKDGGLDAAKKFYSSRCLPAVKSVLADRHHSNWRRKLHDLCHKKHHKQPTYVLLEEKGPEHSKIYKMGIFMDDNLLAKGKGRTKKLAASEAASKALEKI